MRGDIARYVVEDAGTEHADALASAEGYEPAPILSHLHEIRLDYEVAGSVIGATIFQRLHLVGRAGDDRLVETLAPCALEVEEHDDAVAQAVGSEDGDLRGFLAHGGELGVGGVDDILNRVTILRGLAFAVMQGHALGATKSGGVPIEADKDDGGTGDPALGNAIGEVGERGGEGTLVLARAVLDDYDGRIGESARPRAGWARRSGALLRPM